MNDTRSGNSFSGAEARDSSVRQLVGKRLGRYRVTGLLGSGGMGEVWRAEDARLGREVALKILPEELAADPDRMARFEREAKLLGSLNHPNIATLYGLENLPVSVHPDASDTAPDERVIHVLVMELITGEGLDEIISRGPLSIGRAIRIALQMADALQAAHTRGIVHRDLKPANIRVQADDTVKVLDFGLATTRQASTVDGRLSLDLTMSSHGTAIAGIVGTAAYMSPEQARGHAVDQRADIWAFGCLLYEMLTGGKAFGGGTLSDTMAAVLKDEPRWRSLPAKLEPVAKHVLRRCLAKDPDRRFHDIADVRIELEEASAIASSPGAVRRRLRRERLAWGFVAVAALALGALALWARPQPTSLPGYRALTFREGDVESARFAADGETVIFGTGGSSGRLELFSTRADSVENRPLDLPPADILGISDRGMMAILLDRHREGSWVTVGTLATADLAGGAPRPLLERVNDGDISADGSALAVAREVGNSQRLEYPIGRVLFETNGWISSVRIAPDGERVAFLHHPFYGDDRGQVAMVEADGRVVELSPEMADSLQGLAWSADGETVWYTAFVFGRGGILWSVEPGGEPVERLSSPVAFRLQDLAADGRALLVAGDSRAEVAGRLAGHVEERSFAGWNDDSVGGIAADGSMFAGNMQVATIDGEYAAFARMADGAQAVRVGIGDVLGVSPDGRWVFTQKMTGDLTEITLLPTGAGSPRVIDLGGVTVAGSGRANLTVSRDGRRVAFTGTAGDLGPQVHILEIDSGSIHAIGPPNTRHAIISPDGSMVATLDPEGAIAVYPTDGGEGRTVPGITPGEEPLQWTRDGSALLVWDRSFPAHIERVDLTSGERTRQLTIMPHNPAGVLYGQVLLAPGGDHYVYRYRRRLNTLFLVDGLRR